MKSIIDTWIFISDFIGRKFPHILPIYSGICKIYFLHEIDVIKIERK